MYIRLVFTLIGVCPVVLLVVFGGGHAVAQPGVERDGQPDADSGRVTPAAGRTAGMEGDGSTAMFHWPVPPVTIREAECPVRTIEAEAADGRPVRALWRRPQGDEPLPAIVFIHGGLIEFLEASLRQHLTANPIITRFLAAGYAVVMATFRTYEKDVQSRGPIEDVRAVVRATARLPGGDAEVRVEYREYPGYGHGCYFGGGADRWGRGADERVVTDVVRDVRGFFDRAMPATSAEDGR